MTDGDVIDTPPENKLSSTEKLWVFLLEHSNSIHVLEKNFAQFGLQINELVTHLNKVNNECAAKIMKLEQRTAELESLVTKNNDRRLNLVNTNGKDESFDG